MVLYFDKDESVFENIKHILEDGTEYWNARELQHILEYAEWRNFLKVVDKAKIACENSGISVDEHFVDVNKMVDIGKEKLNRSKISSSSSMMYYRLY